VLLHTVLRSSVLPELKLGSTPLYGLVQLLDAWAQRQLPGPAERQQAQRLPAAPEPARVETRPELLLQSLILLLPVSAA